MIAMAKEFYTAEDIKRMIEYHRQQANFFLDAFNRPDLYQVTIKHEGQDNKLNQFESSLDQVREFYQLMCEFHADYKIRLSMLLDSMQKNDICTNDK